MYGVDEKGNLYKGVYHDIMLICLKKNIPFAIKNLTSWHFYMITYMF